MMAILPGVFNDQRALIRGEGILPHHDTTTLITAGQMTLRVGGQVSDRDSVTLQLPSDGHARTLSRNIQHQDGAI